MGMWEEGDADQEGKGWETLKWDIQVEKKLKCEARKEQRKPQKVTNSTKKIEKTGKFINIK